MQELHQLPNRPNLRFFFKNYPTAGLVLKDFVGGCQDVVGKLPLGEKLGRHFFTVYLCMYF